MDKLTVICWKWNNGIHPKKKLIFTAEHVNILYAMIKRNLNLPFEMACITDEPKGIHKAIRIIPIWGDYRELGGCFVRLKVFSAEAQDLLQTKRFVSIDLDTVIIDDITPILDRAEDFWIWGEPWRKMPYCGSFWMLRCGARKEVWEKFDPKNYKPNANGKYSKGSDQWHINNILYPGEMMWTAQDGIYNFATDIKDYGSNTKREQEHFKRVHCRPGFAKKKGGNGQLPGNARIIFFNGQHDPSDKKLQEQYPWIRKYWHL